MTVRYRKRASKEESWHGAIASLSHSMFTSDARIGKSDDGDGRASVYI